MGVELFILDRRIIDLEIGDTHHVVGICRPIGKISEMTAGRAKAIADAAALPAPPAVMISTPSNLALEDGSLTSAHRVLGWDHDRSGVTDQGWDFLPVLGFAIRHSSKESYALHELLDDISRPVSRARGVELGLLDETGHLIRRGQPRITGCSSVQPFISGYAQAQVEMEGGRSEKLVIRAPRGSPPPEWLVGQRPMDVESYDPA
ncbi:hypothetical protein [Lichenicola sp.]|uniref:hypothetical protein n=1 Tax=Lichenicola sp. TaxID=2804529 RepID=UPI003B0023B2